jgi:competence protein ComEA
MGECLRRLAAIIGLAVTLGVLPCKSWVPVPQSHGKTAKLPAAAIDINRATADDFQQLPGIGPKLAKEIVAYRDKHGPFRRVEDLMAIKGIGFKKWKEIRPYVRVESIRH